MVSLRYDLLPSLRNRWQLKSIGDVGRSTTPRDGLWPSLPERDEYEHSQNSARRSITLPCYNRVPAKGEMGNHLSVMEMLMPIVRLTGARNL